MENNKKEVFLKKTMLIYILGLLIYLTLIGAYESYNNNPLHIINVLNFIFSLFIIEVLKRIFKKKLKVISFEQTWHRLII